jgi:hypothetical protein
VEISQERKVIPFSKEDLPTIALFFKNHYSGSGSYGSMGLFNWKIIDNYLRPGFINLIKDGANIAAITSLVPKSLVYRGVKTIIGEIGDTYIDRKYQKLGLFQIIGNKTREEATNSGIEFVYGLPNKLALPGWKKRANFRIMENLNVISMVIPIDFRPIIQKKTHWMIAAIVGTALTVLSFLYFRIKIKVLKYDNSIDIDEKKQLPDDWDIFWGQAKTGYDFILSRDRKAIDWRYMKNPEKYNFIFLRKNEVLIGYLIYRLIHDDDSKKLMIADYLTLPGHEDLLGEGIVHIINLAYQFGASVAALWSVKNNSYQKVFSKFGFINRETIPVISYKNEFSDQIELCSSWHFTLADSDNI